MRFTSYMRSTALIVAIACGLLVLLEVSLRISGVQPVFNIFSEHHGIFADGVPDFSTPELQKSPRFITNELGIWSGNPELPYINESGFRSPPFDEEPGARPTIAIIGDSFVWGESAVPLENSFVDRLRHAGYRTVNLGIPGVGPEQYAAVAEAYLQHVAPEVVILSFYPGNDFDWEPPVVPGQPRYYATTDFMIPAYDNDGNSWSMEEAHAYYASLFGSSPSAWLWRSALSLRVLSIPVGFLAKTTPESNNRVRVLENVARVRRAATEAGAAFLLLLIPVRKEFENESNSIAFCREFFAEEPIIVPELDDAEFYGPYPDTHLSNAGHARVAQFLTQQLSAVGHVPKPEDPTHSPVEVVDLTEDRLTWENVAQFLGLTDGQRTMVLEDINGMKEDFARIYALPATDSDPSPFAFLSQRLREASKPPLGEAHQEFLRYAETAREAESGETYANLLTRAVEQRVASIAEALNLEQKQLFQDYVLDRVLGIDTGHDPLAVAMGSAYDSTVDWGKSQSLPSISIDELRQILDLSPAQLATVTGIVLTLKERYAELYGTPTSSGEASPLAYLAALIVAEETDEVARHHAFEAYSRAHMPANESKHYDALFALDVEAAHREFQELLTMEQRGRLAQMPVDSLIKITFDRDPILERIQKLAGDLQRGEAVSNPLEWSRIAATLELEQDEAQEMGALIAELKQSYQRILALETQSGAESPTAYMLALREANDPEAATRVQRYLQQEIEKESGLSYARRLEQAEIKVRQQLYQRLTETQRQKLEAIVEGSLTEIMIDAMP